MFATPLATATFLTFVCVLLFLALMIYLKVPKKIAGALDQRSGLIAKELSDARRLRDEAHALLEDYKRKAVNAEKEAASILTQAKDDAERLKADAEKTVAELIERRTRVAENKIAQAEGQALSDVRAAATDVAIAAAQEVLAARMKAGLGAEFIDKSIADVRSQLN